MMTERSTLSGCNNDGHGSSHRDSNSSRALNRELDFKLRVLPFRSFQQLVLLWLGAKGYRHIQSLGRHYRRGRRSIGGADFQAVMPGASIAVAIGLRHWSSPVSRRAVDELWGYMLRSGVPTGLIITNSTFSMRAIDSALEFPGRPIRFISRTRLVAWLICSGLGIRIVGGQQVVDEGFFRVLAASSLAGAPGDPPPTISSPFGQKIGMPCADNCTEGDSKRGTHLPPPQLLLLVVALAILLSLLLWLGGCL
jgi:hypothetical protein